MLCGCGTATQPVRHSPAVGARGDELQGRKIQSIRQCTSV